MFEHLKTKTVMKIIIGGHRKRNKNRLSHHQLKERQAAVRAFERAVAEAILLASGLNVRPAPPARTALNRKIRTQYATLAPRVVTSAAEPSPTASPGNQ